jgi:hypothetical protein
MGVDATLFLETGRRLEPEYDAKASRWNFEGALSAMGVIRASSA